MGLKIYIDGGSRGNPGPAAAGVVIRDESDRAILEAGYYLGHMTNNMAEYTALLMALEAASRWGADQIEVYSDSELLVRQLTGQYQVRDEKLVTLFEQAQRLLLRFDTWSIQHVNRASNRRADELVNRALDAQADVIEVQLGDARPEKRSILTPKARPPANRLAAIGLKPAPAEPQAAVVLVRVVRGANSRLCKATLKAGQQFLFSHTVPAGLCVYAAKALIDTVLALRHAAEAGETPSPMRVRCSLAGCGAEFEVTLARQDNGKQQPDNGNT